MSNKYERVFILKDLDYDTRPNLIFGGKESLNAQVLNNLLSQITPDYSEFTDFENIGILEWITNDELTTFMELLDIMEIPYTYIDKECELLGDFWRMPDQMFREKLIHKYGRW